MKERPKPWIQKYSPQKTIDVIGQAKAVAALKQFIVNFRKEKKKAMILYGPTGSGKTSSVYSIANELDLEIVELNASDFRTSHDISSIIGTASRQMSLFFKGKIILVDEVDGISGTKDRGGLQEIGRLVQDSAFPIVMTAIDPFDKKFSSLRKVTSLVEFEELSTASTYEILQGIADQEKINYDEDALRTIARRSGGDARAAVNDLQVLTSDGTLKKDDLESLSDRERVEEINTALTKIFKTTDPLVAKHSFDTVKDDLKNCMMWVDENLPREYDAPEDLGRAYDFLSRADMMNRRIMRWQHWRFLAYINDFISAGVAVSKDKKYRKMVDYQRSERPLKIFIANRKYQKRLAICEKIADKTHSSKKDVLKSTYPFIKQIFRKCEDKEILAKMADELNLDTEEITYLKR